MAPFGVAGYGGRADSEGRSQDGGSTVQLSDITKESEENANRGVERGRMRAKGNVWRREYHFRSDPRVD